MGFDTPINSNDQSFDRVLSAGLPVLTVLTAGAPAGPLQDALKQLAKGNADKLLVVQVRADENPGLVQRFAVRAPTLITFKDKSEFTRAEMPTADDARAHTDYLLGRGPKPAAPPPPAAQPAGAHTSANGSTTVMDVPLHVTDATFARDVLGAPLPVMVDFWAEWCGPCRMIAPALEKLAKEYAGRVRIAKLNVDENQRTSMQYHVQGIPTLLLVKNGKIVDRVVGALPEPQLRQQLERLLRA
jgi:thioredoxin 1